MSSLPSQQELLTALQASLTSIQKLKARIAATEEPVAVIGLACRAPGGVHDSESLWRLLESRTDAVHEIPASRWPEIGRAHV